MQQLLPQAKARMQEKAMIEKEYWSLGKQLASRSNKVNKN
jgi:hypothetical protein